METITVAVRRGVAIESVHRVHAVGLRDGRVVASAGEPAFVTFTRSSAKPLQALSLARAYPDLPTAELAIACASHEAEPPQLSAVQALLARAGANEDDLVCGPPHGRDGASPLRHPCSGKQAGLLAVCRARGWDRTGYHQLEHPLQQEILGELEAAAAVPAAASGIDGCGVVTFALPLDAVARAFARLPGIDAGERVLAAMRAHPELIGGTRIVDTELMLALPGWVAKRGAEGLLCGLAPDGLAVVLKVEDGAQRAVWPALVRFLTTVGIEVEQDLGRERVVNSRGEEVGEVVAL
jgi:L-asparaginase II